MKIPFYVAKFPIYEHFLNVLYHKNSISFHFQVIIFDTFSRIKTKIIYYKKSN
ncbi:hypothetical protein LMQOC1_30273 [Listeria monocytogenes QOC1]|nr:hypothetical protein LMQOC1_30273 [Listeria monocytogenes QOC1]CDN69179.1 hypothetical protein LM4423_50329 [Listeria monocytogenes 4423]